MRRLAIVCAVIGLMFAPGHAASEEMPGGAFKAAIDSDGVQRVEVVGGSFFFSPSYIIVKAHVPVELTVRKEAGVVPHNIVMNVPEAGISFDANLGNEPRTIRFTPRKTGIYPFYCSKKLLAFESHREKGMEGLLEVIE